MNPENPLVTQPPTKNYAIIMTMLYSILTPFLYVFPIIIETFFNTSVGLTDALFLFFVTLTAAYLLPISIPISLSCMWYCYAKKSYSRTYFWGAVPVLLLILNTILIIIVKAL